MGKIPENGSSLMDFGPRYKAQRLVKSGLGVETFFGLDTATQENIVIKSLRKSSLSTAARMRLTHEAKVLRSIDSIYTNSLVHLESNQDNCYMVTSFVDGTSLEEYLRLNRTLVWKDAARMALCVLKALKPAHEYRIVHGDIKPANIILQPKPSTGARLVDFGLARSPLLMPTLNAESCGTLFYCSPEQLGVIPADLRERSDLFSVGVVLFECLTGRNPFSSTSASEYIQNLVTTPDAELRSNLKGVPNTLVEIIVRLLQRDPDNRYQTAVGVISDIIALIEHWEKTGEEPDLIVGMDDLRCRLTQPEFIGRKKDLNVFFEALDNISETSDCIFFLESESGGGKTRLLEEFSCRAKAQGSLVFWGQGVDQAACRPFEVLNGIVDGIARTCGSDAKFQSHLREALGEWTDTVVSVFPELASLAGRGTMCVVGPEEFAESRSLNALSQFLCRLGSPENPVVLILDDFQWADELSVRFIQFLASTLVSKSGVSNLMVVVSYRSEEIDSAHPLRGVRPRKDVVLKPFTENETRQLLLSMAGKLPDEVTALIVRLSLGSPFMASAVLRGLTEVNVLRSTPAGWETDESLLKEAQSSSQAAVFLKGRFHCLPPECLDVLKVAAVLGKRFDVGSVALVGQLRDVSVVKELKVAVRRHLLWKTAQGEYEFVHDKLRESLLALIDSEKLKELHRQSALKLEAIFPERIFEIGYHFDAAGLPQRAFVYAKAAAEQARTQHALSVAEMQYRIALRGSVVLSKENQFDTLQGLALVLLLRGKYADSKDYYLQALSLADSDRERAEIQGRLGELSFKQGDMQSSILHLRDALRILKQPFYSSKPSLVLGVLWESLIQVFHTLFPSLFLHRRKHPAPDSVRLALSLYSRLAYAYWFAIGRWGAWPHLREMNLAERYPPSLELAQAYSEHAPVMTLVPLFRRGIEYAKRSYHLRKELKDPWGEGQALHFNGVALYGSSQYEETIHKCREASRILTRTGDMWEVHTSHWHIALAYYRKGELGNAKELAQNLYHQALKLGDVQSAGIALSVWSKASGGQAPISFIEDQLKESKGDLHTRVELLQGKAINELANDEHLKAIRTLEEGCQLMSNGLVQEYTVPTTAWLVTALRRRLESLPPYTFQRRRRCLKKAKKASRKALWLALRFQNNLPHVLRERALLFAMEGNLRRADRLLKRSMSVAKKQGAVYEEALSRLKWARLGILNSWSDSQAELDLAVSVLKSINANLRLEGESIAVSVPQEEQPAVSHRFGSLLQLGRRLVSCFDKEELYKVVDQAARNLLFADKVLLLQLGPNGDLNDYNVLFGSADHRFSRSLVSKCLEEKQTVVLNEGGASPGESAILRNISSAIASPIFASKDWSAVLYVEQTLIGGLFGDNERKTADFIATFTGGALEQIEGRQKERDAEKKFQLAIEAAPNAMILIDQKGTIQLSNKQAEILFGYGSEELLGMSVESLVPLRFREKHPSFRASFISNPKPRPMGAGRDLYGLRKDGAEVPVEIGLTPIHTPQGVYVMSAIVDITERKRSEIKLQQQTEELLRSNRELEQFAYVASHDLQEPLRMVRIYCEMLAEECGDEMSDDAKRFIGYATTGASRMRDLIDDLLSYSRAGRSQFPLETVDLNASVELALDNLRQTLVEAKAKVVVDPLPSVIAHQSTLVQLFQNLIGNAVKFSRPGVPARVHVYATQEGGWVCCHVKDNGIGIPTQHLERIFQVFQRLHTREEYPGTGIGLAICKKIAENVEGKLWATSEVGKGSTFSIRLRGGNDD